VVEGYPALGGNVVDLALVPNTQPFLGRGIAALDSGGFAIIDFALGETSRLEGPRVGFLAAAPDFQLRGSPAPLVIGAGGALAAPQAWVFLAEEGELVEMPMDPIAPEGPVRALCAERATEALIDLLVFTDSALERWRVSDRGQERLAAERLDSTPIERPIVACAGVGGEVVGVSETGVTRALGQARWGFSDGSDVASIERSDGGWAIVARPPAVSLIAPLSDEVAVIFEEGLNAPTMPAPGQVAASAANFGGSFGEGILILAQDDRVNAFELNSLITSAKDALNGGTPSTSSD
jgi:hypothetical protein